MKEFEQVIEKILSIKQKYPDMRFGQIIANANAKEFNHDLFFMKDEELVNVLQDYLDFASLFTPDK